VYQKVYCDNFQNFFKVLESDAKKGESKVQEWSVSNTTLEEVFLRLAVANKQVNAGIEFDQDDFRLCVICNKNKPSCETLYTVEGVSVLVDKLVCHKCAAKKEKTVEEVLEIASSESDEDSPQIISSDLPKKRHSSKVRFEDQEDEFQLDKVRHEVTGMSQIRGIFLKAATLQAREKTGNICRIICIFNLICLLAVMGFVNTFINPDSKQLLKQLPPPDGSRYQLGQMGSVPPCEKYNNTYIFGRYPYGDALEYRLGCDEGVPEKIINFRKKCASPTNPLTDNLLNPAHPKDRHWDYLTEQSKKQPYRTNILHEQTHHQSDFPGFYPNLFMFNKNNLLNGGRCNLSVENDISGLWVCDKKMKMTKDSCKKKSMDHVGKRAMPNLKNLRTFWFTYKQSFHENDKNIIQVYKKVEESNKILLWLEGNKKYIENFKSMVQLERGVFSLDDFSSLELQSIDNIPNQYKKSQEEIKKLKFQSGHEDLCEKKRSQSMNNNMPGATLSYFSSWFYRSDRQYTTTGCQSDTYARVENMEPKNLDETAKKMRNRFPDIALSLNNVSDKQLDVVLNIQVRDAGYDLQNVIDRLTKTHDQDFYFHEKEWWVYARPTALFYSMVFFPDASITPNTAMGVPTASFVSPTSPMQLHTMVTMLNNIMLKEIPHISATVISFPGYQFLFGDTYSDMLSNLHACLLPFLSMIFFPVMVANIAQEHREKLVVLMQVHLLKSRWYWTATYLWYFSLYLMVMSTYTLAAYLVELAHFDWFRYTMLIMLWGHAQISFAVFLAAVMMKSAFINLSAYFIMLVTSASAQMLLQVFPGEWPILIFTFTPIAFMRGFVLLLLDSWGDGPSAEFDWVCFFLFFIGTLMLVAGLLIQLSIGDEMAPLKKWWEERQSKGQNQKMVEEEMLQLRQRTNEDPDVTAEREKMHQIRENLSPQLDDDVKIQIQGIGKKYEDGPWAVKEITFGVHKGECFGLLGPNGAGKTTLISMLSGYISKSYGYARIGGFDVTHQNEQAREVLGVCPQFDYLFDELTVEEHLLLYGRIKGLPIDLEHFIVHRVACFVGLDGDAFLKKTAGLSGGMKRRLTIALALLTSPDVVLLDEPTTGLDPETRQEVWNTLADIKSKRAVILTTHSMEEADALCDNIGIMASGRLRCLGTPLHLKHKFGSGFQLAVTYLGSKDAVIEFVQALVKNAKLVEAKLKVLRFLLPREETQVSHIFKMMEENRAKYHITEWSFSETSLDEVFLRIADGARLDDDPQEKPQQRADPDFFETLATMQPLKDFGGKNRTD